MIILTFFDTLRISTVYLKGIIIMYVKLIAHTPDPEKLVANAAKLCYSSSNIDESLSSMDRKSIESFLNVLSKLGHESPLEHVSFTFAIEGVSRALLAQFTRHRIASYSVQSQRYVKSEEPEFVIPPAIEKIPEAKKEFLNCIKQSFEAYNRLSKILQDNYKASSQTQNINPKNNFERISIEDARYVLPNAWCTKIICTFNARSLLNFFKYRCCNRAQWEIRMLAYEMYTQVREVAPNLFANAGPSCVNGKCTEGKMTCGQAESVKKIFKKEVSERD